MQQPLSHKQFFKPLRNFDHGFWTKVESNIERLTKVKNTCPLFHLPTDRDWFHPVITMTWKDSYNIIILIARVTQVKIMWRNTLNEDDSFKVVQHLRIIGDLERVELCHKALNYIFEGIVKFEHFITVTQNHIGGELGFRTGKAYARSLTRDNLERICNKFSKFQGDKKYKVRLENYIMGQYKLDYKNYGQDVNAYWNAVSKDFHHKRMMI